MKFLNFIIIFSFFYFSSFAFGQSNANDLSGISRIDIKLDPIKNSTGLIHLFSSLYCLNENEVDSALVNDSIGTHVEVPVPADYEEPLLKKVEKILTGDTTVVKRILIRIPRYDLLRDTVWNTNTNKTIPLINEDLSRVFSDLKSKTGCNENSIPAIYFFATQWSSFGSLDVIAKKVIAIRDGDKKLPSNTAEITLTNNYSFSGTLSFSMTVK